MSASSLFDRIKVLANSLQFFWAIGHFVTLFNTALYILNYNSSYYYTALIGTLLSYGLVLYRTYAASIQTPGVAQKMAADDNFSYAFLSLSWYSSPNVLSVALIPFATYSLFHVCQYAKSEALPKLFPGRFQGTISQLDKLITTFQPQAVEFVVKWECWVVFPFTLLFFLPGFPSFMRMIAMILFLSTRYQNSGVVRAVVTSTLAKIDEFSKHPSVPSPLKGAYDKARSFLLKKSSFRSRNSPTNDDKDE